MRSEISFDWVGGDTIYGNSAVLRQSLKNQGQAFVLDVGQELGVYLEAPEPQVPVVGAGRGRKPSQLVSGKQTVQLKELLEKIAQPEWRELEDLG